MTPALRKWLFETLYKNRYLYRFASTVPFAGQWRIWQRQVLPRLRGHDVLELGCGLGDLLADMVEQGYNCRAVEHSPQMVAAARATLRKRRGQPGWVMQGMAQHLPFPDASFDTVVSTFPSEYIYDPATIAEAARVLRSGGRLIVIEGASLLPVGFIQPLLVGVQALVYGPGATLRRREKRVKRGERHIIDENGKDVNSDERRNDEKEAITEEVPPTSFGQYIPLERSGLHRRAELVRSRRWEVYITLGEKD